MKIIGKSIFVVGLILFLATIIGYISFPSEISQISSPMQPAGIGGTAQYQNGNPLPNGITVTVINLNTNDTNTGMTQNGYFAVGISAKNNDIIQSSLYYREDWAKNQTVVDLSHVTTWCNLTLGKTINVPPPPPEGGQPFQEALSTSWWALVLGAVLMIIGVVYDHYEKKKK